MRVMHPPYKAAHLYGSLGSDVEQLEAVHRYYDLLCQPSSRREAAFADMPYRCQTLTLL